MQQTGTKRSARSGEKDNFRPDIEGLRGVAVLLVVFFHAGLLSNASFQMTGGFIGVDLFFVVSGFLITGLLIRERERTGTISFSKFYARRVRRILPAAAVTLLITIPLSYYLVTLIQRPDTMQDAASAALSFANVRFALTTDYFNPVSYSPFLHFWSLGVEEQFYFVWPALLLVAALRSPRLGAFVALAAVVVLSFAASLYMTDQNASWAFYMLPTRAWQLAAGGLLAIGAGSLARLPGAIAHLVSQLLVILGWLALAALLIDAFAIDSRTVPYPGAAALVPTVAGVLLIASGAEAHGPGAVLRLMPIRFIGKISYSLYLWHWPMLILGGLYLNGADQLNALVPGQVQQILTTQQAIALALFSIPVATVSWGLVEEPIRRGYIPLPRPSRVVAAGVAVMLIVAAVGTSFNFSAQTALANLGGNDTPIAEATDTTSPDETPTDVPDTPTPTVGPTETLPPGATPTPTPALTPALTMAPVKAPTSFAVAGLKPALAAAPKDYEAPWRNGCLGWVNDTVPSAKCVYGNTNGKYTVALIGDSHGSAMFPAVNEVARAHGWRLVVYLKIDCSFVDIPIKETTTLKREYTECATWNNTVIARLNARPPNLVIVHMSRWIFNVNPADAGYAAQGRAMAREMQKIPKQSQVVMIEDIPDPWNMDVPDCLSQHLTDYRSCSYARSTGFGSYWGKREAVASQASGVPLIDPSPWICPGTGRCPVVTNGMIMFRDQHHLTATFAKSLGPALDQKLVPILVAANAGPSAPPSASPSPGG